MGQYVILCNYEQYISLEMFYMLHFPGACLVFAIEPYYLVFAVGIVLAGIILVFDFGLSRFMNALL